MLTQSTSWTADQKPLWIGEVKWSDRIDTHFNEEVSDLEVLLGNHKSINAAFFTTKTISRESTIMGRPLHIRPIAFQCYTVGRNVTAPLNEIVTEVVTKAAA
jgi:hypothetical protein